MLRVRWDGFTSLQGYLCNIEWNKPSWNLNSTRQSQFLRTFAMLSTYPMERLWSWKNIVAHIRDEYLSATFFFRFISVRIWKTVLWSLCSCGLKIFNFLLRKNIRSKEMLNLFAEIGRYLSFFYLLKCIFFLGVVGEDIKVNRNYFLKFLQSTAMFCFFAVKLI